MEGQIVPTAVRKGKVNLPLERDKLLMEEQTISLLRQRMEGGVDQTCDGKAE